MKQFLPTVFPDHMISTRYAKQMSFKSLDLVFTIKGFICLVNIALEVLTNKMKVFYCKLVY